MDEEEKPAPGIDGGKPIPDMSQGKEKPASDMGNEKLTSDMDKAKEDKEDKKKNLTFDIIIKAIISFILPILISALYLIILFGLLDESLWPVIGILILSYFISPFGKEVLIPGAMIGLLALASPPSAGYAIILVATSVIFVDVMCSFFLVLNLPLITKIPVLGKFILRFESIGRKKLAAHPDKRFWARLGLAAYVALPFQGSGGIMATILGVLGGMRSRVVLISVIVGSTIGCFAIAYPAYFVGQKILDIFGSAISYLIGTMVMLGIIVFLILRYLRSLGKGDRSSIK